MRSTSPRLISVRSSPVPRRCHKPRSGRSTPQPRGNVSAESHAAVEFVGVESVRTPSTVESGAGSSVLDELASWQKLKKPLERYLEFVRCNYFGPSDDQQPIVLAARDSATRADDVDVRVSTSKMTQLDDGRLLQRPRTEPLHITSSHSHHQLSDQSQH